FADTHSGAFEPDNPLQLMYMQEALEQICWQQAGFSQRAPSQRMTDFVSNRLSADLPSSSYAPGQIASPLHFWMPDFFTNRLQNAFIVFNKRQRGFLSKEAALLAIETRTSSPVRILRNRETYQHIRLEGLFPCGEGAGYAGGIVSAAVDGEACADMAATYIAETPQA
ncbi:MAG: FAD-binding protein, partial [Alloprevotella sp.]|nr:FAD-binding protein [Alloprevotella sp.]